MSSFTAHGKVAVITMNTPPMNTMSALNRKNVAEGLRDALADPNIDAIVITGGGKVFSSGAEIREFNTPAAFAEPNLGQLIGTLEAATKPVVAAIHGVAMGGGLELALGCHYRVAAPRAQIALPEVKLGLLPGAGGTQRLPRLIGAEKSCEMIVAGNQVMSEKFVPGTLFEEIIDGDLVAGAVKFAASVVGKTPYSEKIPNVDEGFTHADLKDEMRAEAIRKVIRSRLAKSQKERPIGYLVREAPADDVKDLQKLAGHLQENWFITKFRKIFARDEMNDDLAIVPARYNGAEDTSEYEEILPSSPP